MTDKVQDVYLVRDAGCSLTQIVFQLADRRRRGYLKAHLLVCLKLVERPAQSVHILGNVYRVDTGWRWRDNEHA